MSAVPRRRRDEGASTNVNVQRGNMTKAIGMQESRGSAFHLPVRNRFAQRLIGVATHDEGGAKKSTTMTDGNSRGFNVAAGDGTAKMEATDNSHDVTDLAKTGTSEKISAQALGDPKVLEHRVALMERERIPMTAMRALVMDFLMP